MHSPIKHQIIILFDPFTSGHVFTLERGVEEDDFIAVRHKKINGVYTVTTRKQMITVIPCRTKIRQAKLSADKNLCGQNFSHFCPPNLCPIRYFVSAKLHADYQISENCFNQIKILQASSFITKIDTESFIFSSATAKRRQLVVQDEILVTKNEAYTALSELITLISPESQTFPSFKALINHAFVFQRRTERFF